MPEPDTTVEDLLSRPPGYLLRTHRVATILDRSTRSIRQLVRRGYLTATLQGHKFYFTVAEVQRYIDSHTKKRKGKK